MSDLKTARFWTQVEGEEPVVSTFALIPQGWEDKLHQHPEDDSIYYWLTEEEWLAIGAGEEYGGAEIIACACEECESERFADSWREELS